MTGWWFGTLSQCGCVLLAGWAMAGIAAEPPQIMLQQGLVRIEVAAPVGEEAFYRGQRFDHGGIIPSVRYDGHELCGCLRSPRDPTVHDHAAGICEEFAPVDPPDYGQRADHRFWKPGVGILVGDGQPYHFSHRYEVADPGSWAIDSTLTTVRFTHTVADPEWKGVYTKEVEVGGDRLTIRRSLVNHSPRAWDLLQYGHAMLRFGPAEIGPAYEVRVAEVLLRPARPVADNTWRTLQVRWNTPLQEIAVSGDGYTMALSGDLPAERVELYAEPAAICPEPFVRIQVPVGGETRWSTVYRMSRTPP